MISFPVNFLAFFGFNQAVCFLAKKTWLLERFSLSTCMHASLCLCTISTAALQTVTAEFSCVSSCLKQKQSQRIVSLACFSCSHVSSFCVSHATRALMRYQAIDTKLQGQQKLAASRAHTQHTQLFAATRSKSSWPGFATDT